MKKITLMIGILLSISINSYAWWTNLYNTGAPWKTYYLGDTQSDVFEFGVNENTISMTVTYGIGTTANGSGWTWRAAEWSRMDGANNRVWKSKANEYTFSSTGNWYYSGKFVWTESGYTEYASAGWAENRTTLTATNYFTVTALSPPTSPSATAASSSQINLSWTKWNSKNVMVLRKKSNQAWTEPAQGTSYAVNATIGDAVVVYNGDASSFNNTSLASSTSYDYKLYSVNNNYYSAGVVVSASTSTATTDKFRSKSVGNWTTIGTWESSSDNSIWISATSAPTSSANSVTIATNVTINSNLSTSNITINSGATLIVNNDIQVTLNTITNNGTFTLKTGATALNTSVSSGTTNIEQSLASGRQWWYLSSPLSGAYTGTVFSGSQVGIYDEDAFNYTDPYVSSTLMSPGVGHVVKFPNTDARTITFTGGSLNNGDITITPTRTGTVNAKRGFNLIGNPYPSYIDWDLLHADAATSNMRDAIWFRTMNGTMTFHTYGDGEAVPITSGVTGKIAPMQGFWVKVHADGSDGSLTFKNTQRSHYAESGYNPLKVKAADDRQRVRLVLSDGTNTDETLIVGKSYASDSQDAYDIEKMSNESTDISEIYSMIGTETMVINSVAPITAGKTVALGIRSTSEKAYSITASQLQNIPTDVRVVLVDAEAETETELSEGVSYNFVASAGAVNNRFSIQFRSPGATTQVDNDSKNKILVYSNSQQQIEIISTESLPAGTQIRVFNAAGQTIAQMQAAGNRISIPASISKGVYFCHIENTNQNLQYKVIVR